LAIFGKKISKALDEDGDRGRRRIGGRRTGGTRTTEPTITIGQIEGWIPPPEPVPTPEVEDQELVGEKEEGEEGTISQEPSQLSQPSITSQISCEALWDYWINSVKMNYAIFLWKKDTTYYSISLNPPLFADRQAFFTDFYVIKQKIFTKEFVSHGGTEHLTAKTAWENMVKQTRSESC